jgi:hypothetical protein
MMTFSQLALPHWGRLGNQLFQIAATIGIAEKNGQSYVFPEWAYADCFANPLPFGQLNNAQVFTLNGSNYKDVTLPDGNWDLRGFFQSEQFFLNVEEKVRHYFEPSAEIASYIETKYGHLLQGKTCSIHIRRGDYLKLKYSFPPQPFAYYQKAISRFEEDMRFLVFSDDIEWCRQNFKGQRFEFIAGERDIIDLLLMSRCKNHILSNSSFSWWGAWLNRTAGKRVICPEHWFGAGMSSNPDKISKDIYARNFEKLKMDERAIAPLLFRFNSVCVYGYSTAFDLLRAFKRTLLKQN